MLVFSLFSVSVQARCTDPWNFSVRSFSNPNAFTVKMPLMASEAVFIAAPVASKERLLCARNGTLTFLIAQRDTGRITQ